MTRTAIQDQPALWDLPEAASARGQAKRMPTHALDDLSADGVILLANSRRDSTWATRPWTRS